MDYEKKYNEALKWMRELYPGLHGATKEDAEHYFPELRESESEDERIRKWLADYFSSIKATVWIHRDITCEQILEWLEKQKYDRMKPIYDARESFESALEKAWNDYHNGYENVDKLEDDYVECAHAKGFREGYLFGIEKQKEQKPNYCHYGGDPSVERCKYCSASCSGRLVEERYSPLCNTIKDKIHEYIANHFIADTVVKTDMRSIVKAMEEGVRLGKEERKPAEWSDSVAKEMFIKALERAVEQTKKGYELTDCDKHSWWEDFKTYSGINPAEWSEKDERTLIHVQSHLKYLIEHRFEIKDYNTIEDRMILEGEIKWLEERLKSLRPQPHKEIYQAAKHDLAIKFMNYLDENRPEGKMSLSNGECEDIDKAFKENDWAKIMRYYEKYQPHWKPSEEQMEALLWCIAHIGGADHRVLAELYDHLKMLNDGHITR